MVDKNPLDKATIDRLFVAAPPASPNTFQLALVLGGTVSAGAYTAGVLDFLIEALDCWTSIRDSEAGAAHRTAPWHDTVLNLIAGASGGGVNAAIAARALAYDFPHITRGSPTASLGAANPFYDVWINRLTLSRLLDTSDIEAGKLVSLLNGQPIDDAAAVAAGFASGTPKARSWVADPLRAILTLTNLRGVPYRTGMGGGLGETFVDHADFARFAFVYPGRGLTDPRPDEFVLGFGGRLPQEMHWDEFSQYARATAAFPIGFPPRPLVRPVDHYRYRVVVVPSDRPGDPDVLPLVPDWDGLRPKDGGEVPEDYHFLTVDGGATDNEPIDLARTSLSGVLGRNPRASIAADRAVLLVDPFAGQADLGPEAMPSLPSLFGSLVSTFTQQTRYDSRDLMLASDPGVFSRFMITPRRAGLTGGEAIASNGLAAFIGFACPAFMRHDYLLGRANCQTFLREQFVLDAENPVFAGVWTPAQIAKYQVMVGGRPHLPLVPLMGDAAIPETTDPWPRNMLDPGIYRDAIEQRFKAAVEFEGNGGFLSGAAAWLLAHAGEDFVADYAEKAMKQALVDAKLA